MPRIPDEEIDRIKRETDLATLIRSRGIELKKHGTKDLIGRCPFHEDTETPNLIVSPEKGLFHCMACGAAGNPIQFVEKFDGVSFRHAFVLLSDGKAITDAPKRKRASVQRLDCPVDPEADDEALRRQVINYYHDRIKAPDAKKARDYLEARGLDCERLVSHFKLGYADRTLGLRLPNNDRATGVKIRSRLIELGFYRTSGHEHLNGSLIVPVFDEHGNVGEVYGRKVTAHLRKGTPEHLYLPGPHRGIVNIAALQQREIILCESLIDAMTFWRHGMENVTSIFGTEGFTDELFEALKTHKIETVRLAYDADEAGERAAKRDSDRLQSIGIECHKVRFPWGQDANSFAVNQGAEALKSAVRQAEWLGAGPAPSVSSTRAESIPNNKQLAAELVADAPKEVANKERPGKSQAVLERQGDHWLLNLDGRLYRVGGLERNTGVTALKITLRVWWDDLFHLDSLDLCNDAHRRKYIERAAEECRLDPELVKRDMGKLLLQLEGLQEEQLDGDNIGLSDEAPEMTREQRREAEAILASPKLVERIEKDFEACGVVGEEINRLVGYLACTSRLLHRPLAVIIQSTSAAGKSTLMEAILTLFPEEERIKYSAMTGQSLYYLGETNLKHKILAIVEEEGAERASYALKLLQSEGELTIASTGKNPQTGQMETQTYYVEGPVMIFLTTTAIDIDEELQNRCLTLSVDETRDQTKLIHEAQRKARTFDGIVQREKREAILEMHRNAQRLLKGYPVCNPYVEQLTFTSDRTRTRRDHEKYLTLIDAVALLHQKQRRVVNRQGVEMIVAEIDDIAIANRLAPEVLGRSLDELPPQTRKLWGQIKKLIVENTKNGNWQRTSFTRRDVRTLTGWSVTQVRIHLDRLAEMEYIATVAGTNGLRFEYICLLDPALPDDVAHIGLIDETKLEPTDYDPNLTDSGTHLTGQKGDLTAPDKTGPSGEKPDEPNKDAA